MRFPPHSAAPLPSKPYAPARGRRNSHHIGFSLLYRDVGIWASKIACRIHVSRAKYYDHRADNNNTNEYGN
jgi:hypothetical protein